MTPALRCPVAGCEEPIMSSRYLGLRVSFTCRHNHNFTMSTEALSQLAKMRQFAETHAQAATGEPQRETDEELTRRIRRALGET
jgi:hypothetical protein